MDMAMIEEALRKIAESMDKGVRLETLMEENGKWTVILSKGNHSDKANLSQELLEGFLQTGKGGKELRHALGKVIAKLNRMAQRRR